MRTPIQRRINWNYLGLLLAAVVFAAPQKVSADQCFNDDLVIDGSIGVGFDATCNMNFGFDTIVLKENNLRIFFDDTSNAASFPNNDWRLKANDTTNGGGNFFAIEDATAGRDVFKVEAGARTNALYVESDGDVGIGTNNPVTELHIVRGDSPTVRLEQDGSSGFTPQTWDLAGNETNFFIRDVTNGSKLPFRIRPNSPTSSIDVFSDKIQVGTSAQNVGIGTSSPSGKLHVQSTTGSMNVFMDGYASGNDNVAIQLRRQDAVDANRTLLSRLFATHSNVPDRFRIDHRAGGVQVGIIDMDNDGDVAIGVSNNVNASIDHDFAVRNGALFSRLNAGDTQFTNTSSRELKENIRPVKVDNLLDKVASVPVVTYDWKDDLLNIPEEKRVNKLGLIAEDFHTVLERGSDKVLSGQEIQMTLWMSVQELHAENRELKSRLVQLEQQIQPEDKP